GMINRRSRLILAASKSGSRKLVIAASYSLRIPLFARSPVKKMKSSVSSFLLISERLRMSAIRASRTTCLSKSFPFWCQSERCSHASSNGCAPVFHSSLLYRPAEKHNRLDGHHDGVEKLGYCACWTCSHSAGAAEQVPPFHAICFAMSKERAPKMRCDPWS